MKHSLKHRLITLHYWVSRAIECIIKECNRVDQAPNPSYQWWRK